MFTLSLQFVFGDIERSVSKGESVVKILEDHKEWEGCSDLIVTFYVPSWTLLNCDPKSLKIGLHFHDCASTMLSLSAKLGSFRQYIQRLCRMLNICNLSVNAREMLVSLTVFM